MRKSKLIEIILFISALLSIIFLLAITIALVIESLPTWTQYGPIKFIFGKYWRPTETPPAFGILALLLSSLTVTFGALAVAVLLGVGSAIFLAEFIHPRHKEIIKPVIETLGGIPSVVYGFFGIVILSPIVQDVFQLPTGLTAFTAAVILGIMALPIVVSLSEDALTSVPREWKEGSLALGATRWETLVHVSLPAARSGIVTAVILGFGRAIGETMTVLMVAGGATALPRTIFQPVRPMTATIAAEMGESSFGSPHYSALFAIALVLFLITLGFNILVEFIKGRK